MALGICAGTAVLNEFSVQFCAPEASPVTARGLNKLAQSARALGRINTGVHMHQNTPRSQKQMHILNLSERNLREKNLCGRNERPHTEHGHVLLAVEVPVAPVGSVAMQGGVLLVVVSRLCAEGVNHSDVAPGTK